MVVDKLRVERAEELAADRWESRGVPTAPTRNLRPHALAVHTFHMRFNAYELELLQLVADLGTQSKQSVARRVVREACEKILKAAKMELPR